MRDRYTYMSGVWMDNDRDDIVDPVEVMNAQNEKISRLQNKSRAHRKSLKDQQRALMERNSRIASLEQQVIFETEVVSPEEATMSTSPVKFHYKVT